LTAQALSHSHRHWRVDEASRAAALAEFDKRFENLKACVHWLVSHGVTVINADLRRHNPKPRVTVVGSPLLHILMKDDCASGGQHWDAMLGRTMHDWVAVRFDCEIRWESAE
jgi:hypothetical protein